MKLSTQSYKGTRDFYPEDWRARQYIFDTWRRVAESFGYEPYDAPLIEPLELYRAKTGEEIVNEQTYSFTDRGDREVAIRPEMTPSVARMVAARRQELSYPLRWFNIGNRWRYERPQRGRVREFWQIDIDLFGVEGLEAEIEALQVAERMMREFGVTDDMFDIRVNSRKLMNVLLSDYFQLDEAQITHVTRLIDKMHRMDEPIFEKALTEIVGERFKELHTLLHASSLDALPESVREFAQPLEEVLSGLAALGIGNAKFDITIVRGLDYYTDIVFEVFDTNPENPRSLFGGGRYDGLVGLFGVHDLPAVGFAWGDVVMRDFLDTHKLLPGLPTETAVYIAVIGDQQTEAMKIADELRGQGINVAVDLGGRKLDQQIKTANKKGIKHALFVGESELKTGKYQLKDLSTGKSTEVSLDHILESLTKKL